MAERSVPVILIFPVWRKIFSFCQTNFFSSRLYLGLEFVVLVIVIWDLFVI